MVDITPDILPITSLPSPAPDNPLEALEWLGSTVEEVADGLRARGIKGIPSDTKACPLARYLQGFGFTTTVDVSCLFDGELHLDSERVYAPVLSQFVMEFDDENLPDLIAEA